MKISELPTQYRKLAKRRINEQKGEIKNNSVASSFSFYQTKEGINFWWAVEDAIEINELPPLPEPVMTFVETTNNTATITYTQKPMITDLELTINGKIVLVYYCEVDCEYEVEVTEAFSLEELNQITKLINHLNK